jgi:MFS transporter, BCD family, chlorophyll transporter
MQGSAPRPGEAGSNPTPGLPATFGWLGVLRLGLVQMAIGAMVVLTTSTLNRVMVVELALPALLPGLLVALHYLVQITRPRMGFGSDVGGRRTPWILGGMAVLALGALGAAAGTAWMETSAAAGLALSVVSFVLIGLGVSAAGTNTLVLLAKRVPAQRRAPAATLVWMMMIFGLAFTAVVAGKWLDPYTPARLVAVMAGVCGAAFLLACASIRGLEGQAAGRTDSAHAEPARPRFRLALAEVWSEPDARRFTIFIFVSMLAFSAQDLILEPFAGTVFGWTPGQTTQLSGLQHGGVLTGMVLVALAGAGLLGRQLRSLRGWAVGGCMASALALAGLVVAGAVGPGWPLAATVFLLGAANGAFSIAAIASMMRLASEGRQRREGVRMGLWGGAQALAFGLGGALGAGASDLARWLIGSPAAAYSTVFAAESVLFIVAALLAMQIGRTAATSGVCPEASTDTGPHAEPAMALSPPR